MIVCKELLIEFCLASVVHHKDFLVDHLPENRPIFQSVLFTESGLLVRLSHDVVCGLPGEVEISVTGIPQSVYHTLELREVRQGLKQVVPGVLGGMDQVLERNGVQGGNFTKGMMVDVITSVLTEHGLINSSSQSTTIQSSVNTSQHRSDPWGSLVPVLPQNFAFRTTYTVPVAWRLWCCGFESQWIPPLRFVQTHQVPRVAKDTRKRYCDYCNLMNMFQEKLESKCEFVPSTCPEQAHRMFERIEDHFKLHDTSQNSNKVRTHHRSWRTVYRRFTSKTGSSSNRRTNRK